MFIFETMKALSNPMAYDLEDKLFAHYALYVLAEEDQDIQN